jgi:hypothetical protein
VDANHPVVRLVAQTERPIMLKAASEIWRAKGYHLDQGTVLEVGGRGGNFWEWKCKPDGLTFDPDTILPARDNRVSWCHFNARSLYPLVFEKEHLESLLPKYPDPLLHRCFGITMKGEHLISIDNRSLKSSSASLSQQLDIYALTEQSPTPESWRIKLDQKIADIDAINRDSVRKAHEQWWTQFWNRSWIHVAGAPEAEKVSQSYAIQRFMTACAGRGAQPIKFNGSLLCQLGSLSRFLKT